MAPPPDESPLTPETGPAPPPAEPADPSRFIASAGQARAARSDTTPGEAVPPKPDALHGEPANGTSARGDNVRPLIEEVRQRLAELNEREYALRRREYELEQLHRKLQQAAEESAEDHFNAWEERLLQRSAELDREALDITGRGAELAQRQQALERRLHEIDRQKEELGERERGLADQREALLEQRSRDRANLTRRIEVIRASEAELERRMTKARDEIRQERDRLADEKGAQQQQVAEVSNEAAQLERRTSQLENREQQLESRLRDLEQQQMKLASERTEMQSRLLEAEQAAKAAEQARESYVQKHRQLSGNAEELRVENERLDEIRAALQHERERLAQERSRHSVEIENYSTQTNELESKDEVLRAREQTVARSFAELKQKQAEIAAARTALEAQQVEAEQLRDAADKARQSFLERHKQLEATDSRLREQAQVHRQQEEQLREQREKVERERQTLHEQAAGLERRTVELDDRGRDLGQRESSLGQRLTALEDEREALNAERKELNTLRGDAERARVEAESSRDRFEDLQRELANRERDQQQEKQALEQQRNALTAQREELLEQRAAHQQREQTLAVEGDKLTQREQELEKQVERAAALEQQLGEKRASVDQMLARAEEVERAAEGTRDELFRQREQLEVREAAVRHDAMSLEVERKQFERDRKQLDQRLDELGTQQGTLDAQLATARAELEEQYQRVRGAAGAVAAAPVRWWGRSLALATCFGIAVGALWFTIDEPQFEVVQPMRIASSIRTPEVAVGHHADRLRNLMTDAEVLEPALVAYLQRARRDGRLQIDAEALSSQLSVSITSADSDAARNVLATLAETYRSTYVEDGFLSTLPPYFEQLRARARALDRERRQVSDGLQNASDRLTATPEVESRESVQRVIDELRNKHAGSVRSVATVRARLAALMGGTAPLGVIEPAAYEERLTADPMMLEDRQELAAASTEYRIELSVALSTVKGPVEELRNVVTGFSATVAEQRALNPPESVARMLEEIATELSALAGELETFQVRWGESIATVSAAEVPDDLELLVRTQDEADKRARKLSKASETRTGAIRDRIEAQRGESDGSTREVVVTAVVRGEIGELFRGVAGVKKAIEAIALDGNFQLDSLDRQVRGLRRRMSDRENVVREQLQVAADRDAQQAHHDSISVLQREIATIERQREAHVLAIAEQTERLHEVEDALFQRAQLEAQHTALKTRQSRITQELQQIETDLRTTEQRVAAVEADRVAPEPLRSTQVAGVHRQRDAAIAGLGGFALCWLVCVLMVMRNPFARARKAVDLDEVIQRIDSTP